MKKSIKRIFISILFLFIILSCRNGQKKSEIDTNGFFLTGLNDNDTKEIGNDGGETAVANSSLTENSIDCDLTPNCTKLSIEEGKSSIPVNRPSDCSDGLFKNQNLSDDDFVKYLNNMEITKLPITLVSEKVCFRDICKESNRSGLEDFYFFNLEKMKENGKIGFGKYDYVLSERDEIIKAYSSYRLPNIGDVKLILYKTVSFLEDDKDAYSVWLLCSIIDEEIVDIISICSTNHMETDLIRYSMAEITKKNIVVKVFNEGSKQALREYELHVKNNGYFECQERNKQ